MGQLVAVAEKRGSIPGLVRFETNRTLTGMGHERFTSALDATGERPAAELARRLFGSGKVAGVHIYANIITVDLKKGYDSSGLDDIVRDLYQYWKPGMEPPSFDDLTAEEAPADAPASGAGGGDTGGDAALSEAAKRVPAELLERSRQARERWMAKQG